MMRLIQSHGGEVQIKVGTKDSKIIVTVKDHGIGIAPEALPNTLNRFYHLEKSGNDLFGGLGLGLSIDAAGYQTT